MKVWTVFIPGNEVVRVDADFCFVSPGGALCFTRDITTPVGAGFRHDLVTVAAWSANSWNRCFMATEPS